MQDMGIEDPEIVELVNQIEELERKLYAHPLHKVCLFFRMNSLLFFCFVKFFKVVCCLHCSLL